MWVVAQEAHTVCEQPLTTSQSFAAVEKQMGQVSVGAVEPATSSSAMLLGCDVLLIKASRLVAESFVPKRSSSRVAMVNLNNNTS